MWMAVKNNYKLKKNFDSTSIPRSPSLETQQFRIILSSTQCFRHIGTGKRLLCTAKSYLVHLFASRALQHSFVQTKFHRGPVKHLALVRVACHQTIHLDCFLLTDTMTACLSLRTGTHGSDMTKIITVTLLMIQTTQTKS